MVIGLVGTGLVPTHPPGTVFFGDGLVNAKSLVVGLSCRPVFTQGPQVGAFIVPGEEQVPPVQGLGLVGGPLQGIPQG